MKLIAIIAILMSGMALATPALNADTGVNRLVARQSKGAPKASASPTSAAIPTPKPTSDTPSPKATADSASAKPSPSTPSPKSTPSIPSPKSGKLGKGKVAKGGPPSIGKGKTSILVTEEADLEDIL